MEYEERILHEKSIIILKVRGEFAFIEIVKLAIKYRKKALQLNYRLIFDLKNTKSDVSVTEVQSYFDDHIYPEDKKLLDVPVGYVCSEHDFVFFKLMQQIWDNKGVFIMIFKDLESGLHWFENHDLPK